MRFRQASPWSRAWRVIALLAALTLLAAACGGDGGDDAAGGDEATDATGGETPDTADEGEEAGGDTGTATESASDGETTTRADADLVIWADDIRAEVMQDIAPQFAEEQGISVAVQEVPFEDLREQLLRAGPAGEGADIILGPNDWLGELVANGALAPVDLPDPDAFEDVAIDAFTYEGQLYGVPFAVENLALYRNTDLVPEAPQTWQELQDTALRLQEEGQVTQGLLVPASPEESPYHNHPMFTAYGGYIFGAPEEGYDTSDVGIDSEGGLAAASAFREWVDIGLINPDITGEIMQQQFGEGQAAFAISGPWALVQGGRGWQEVGVPFAVSPIPAIEGGTPQPFVGVQGFMISGFAQNPLLAQTFVTDFATTDDVQMALFEANTRPPALTSTLEQVSAENEIIAAFGEAGSNGVPLPAVPAMGSVFSALGDAYELIYQNQGDPEQIFRDTASQVRSAVGSG